MLPPLLLGLAPALAPVWASDAFIVAMRKAESFSEDGDKIEFYDRAIRAWEPADGQSLLGECYFRRGEARLRRWEFDGAEADLAKAVQFDPGNAQAKLLWGRALVKQGKASEAVKELLEVTMTAPDKEEGFLWLGEAYLLSAAPAPAARAFGRAEQLDSSDFRGAAGIGRAWLARRDFDKAYDALSRADELAKRRSSEVLTQLGVCEAGRGRHKEALRHYDKAVAILARDLQQLPRADTPRGEEDDLRAQAGKAYFGRGRVSEFLAKIADAASDYRQACELGHREACARAAALAKAPAPKPAPKPAPPAAVEIRPLPKTRKKKTSPPQSDPGERIYGG
jgi:tetratricopeptide (TPR) repeat protein